MTPDNITTPEESINPDISAKKIFPLVLTSIIVGLFIFVASIVQTTIGLKNLSTIVSNFILIPAGKVASDSNRTNILLMGKAGGAHDGTDLTDTIIVASVSLTKPSVSLISIPRDLWIPEIRAKVNSAYYWGNQKGEGGISYAKMIVGKVVGQPIHYGLVMDFSAFKDIVDAVGGIKVDVRNGFTDKLYPVAGKENDLCGGDKSLACRYETITFSQGPQTMDGDTALKFVRSRMAEGDEGTDQAREARQQIVISAIKSKLTNPAVFLNPRIATNIFGILRNSVETDIDMPASAIIARKILDAGDTINQYLVPSEFLVNPPISKIYDSQYVFIPKAGNGRWTSINIWVENLLK